MTNSNTYPFVTKAQLKSRLATDDAFVTESLVTVYNMQATDEQETKSTKHLNRRGFASSDAVVGSTLAQKVLAGETLNKTEFARARKIATRYCKQLCAMARQEAIKADPSLAKLAETFSAS